MGNRESTFMAGLSFQAELPHGVDVSLDYKHDILGRIGGGKAQLKIAKSFQYRVIRLSPEIGFN